MQRLLIAANLNLDMPLNGFTTAARNQRRQESLACFANLAREAISQRVDGMIFAGNLFFTPYPSPPAWQAVKEGAEILAKAGIPLILLAGENDEGPVYDQSLLDATMVLNRGGLAQFLPGLHIVVGQEMPFEAGILRWLGTGEPQKPEGALTILPGRSWVHSEDGGLQPGAPFKLNFDEPEEPSVTLVHWEQGVQSVEQLPLPDRVFATVRWDVEERGVDLSAYLEERQDPELALRLLLFGKIEEPLPVEDWKQQYESGFFHLSFQDETRFFPGSIGASPLANDTFDKRIRAALSDQGLPQEKANQYVRAWILGQNALKGGEKRAD